VTRRVSFGSDNHSGVHPRVMEAIVTRQRGARACLRERSVDRRGTRPSCARSSAMGSTSHFTFNGTGANVVTLATICRPWESVICAETAHINVDECAAPERVASVKLVPVATPDGKLTPDLVRPHLIGFGFEHHAQPRVISVSQASEYGTVYTVDQAARAGRPCPLARVVAARGWGTLRQRGCSSSAAPLQRCLPMAGAWMLSRSVGPRTA
jgi:threonine aldolase